MHPGQSRRLRREEAERTSSSIDVRRYGKKIATASREDSGRWMATMVDGRELPGHFTIGGAETAAINQAKRDEREARS